VGVQCSGQLKNGEEERRNSIDMTTSVVSPVKRDAVYLNKNFRNGLRKILKETITSKEMLKMRQLGS
jgi:hypothetical protein